ncbi:SAM-dependent methyltransferase [Shewanella olleyana]|uniref:SAM-dependent methyltransferase n=1 Tax=Shewanella olleyana TaxID=135626 RepID=UPI00200BAF9F|nr:SAM-dependent methyltransferase [Shewanella olleyana]MCL1067590.1 SAM-dependent methyltransferase [Shewanella olleyana]
MSSKEAKTNQQSLVPPKSAGKVTFVGTGLQLAGQISILSKSYIENADLVFSLVPDGFTERWLVSLNPNHRSLQPYYARKDEVKNRRDTYSQMVEAILEQVRLGLNVVVALYGHPGVFACISHLSIKQAKKEGYFAEMLPGISAEACLWADLGIDPGASGHQSYEATQFMLYHHEPNTNTHLLLWQISLAGEHTLTQFSTTSERLAILVDHLSQWYPLEHEVVIYEAANLPIQSPRIEKLLLKELPYARLEMISTLMIPPVQKLKLNLAMLEKLGISASDIG